MSCFIKGSIFLQDQGYLSWQGNWSLFIIFCWQTIVSYFLNRVVRVFTVVLFVVRSGD